MNVSSTHLAQVDAGLGSHQAAKPPPLTSSTTPAPHRHLLGHCEFQVKIEIHIGLCYLWMWAWCSPYLSHAHKHASMIWLTLETCLNRRSHTMLDCGHYGEGSIGSQEINSISNEMEYRKKGVEACTAVGVHRCPILDPGQSWSALFRTGFFSSSPS